MVFGKYFFVGDVSFFGDIMVVMCLAMFFSGTLSHTWHWNCYLSNLIVSRCHVQYFLGFLQNNLLNEALVTIRAHHFIFF